MKRLNLLVAFGLIMASIAFAGEQPVLARVTVYWHGEGQHRASWNGVRLRNGHCAVDPKKIPYGSKVVLGDAICVAVDTGPAVVSRKAARSSGRTASERNAIVIDRFFESKQQAMAWTKTHPHFMTVHVQTPAAQSADNDTRVAANNANNRVPIPEDTTVRTLASFDGSLPQSALYPAVLASASLCICIALTVRETSNIISPG
jgi:3D (Asp-Asp-Asp) domain-containing protein